jgi:tetratricopeptide (TPR) repeat protein
MVSPTLSQTERFEQAFRHAVDLHKAGRIAEAAAGYQALAAEQPKNPQLLYFLGAAWVHLARIPDAVAALERSLALRPDFVPAVEALGSAWIQAGEPAKGLSYFRRAAQLVPASPEAVDRLANALLLCEKFAEAHEAFTRLIAFAPEHWRGRAGQATALHGLGRGSEAEAVLRDCIAKHPSHGQAYITLGTLLGQGERFTDAEQVLLDAVKAAPAAAEAWRWLGVCRHKQGRFEDAVPAYTQALALHPKDTMIAAHLAEALIDLNRLEEADTVLNQALAHRPEDPALLTARGRVFELRGQLDEAIALQTRVLALAPKFEAAFLNRGSARRFAGDLNGALADYDAALALKPSMAAATAHRAMTLLTLGRLSEAWPHYRARVRARGGAVDFSGGIPWDGSALKGKRALIWGEYGLGDEIMFASLLPELIKDLGPSTLVCAPRLQNLFKRSFPELAIRPLDGEITGAFDARLALIDAAQMLRPTIGHFPTHNGYIKADPALTVALRDRYRAKTGNKLVGISWRSASGATGRFKSAGLELWDDILGVPGITFVSLQYGQHPGDIDDARKRTGTEIIVDPAVDSSGDLDAFAAQVAAMDLVISVSNTTVHVAGALGRPVWVLTPTGSGAHWYWFQKRADSPWYPAARLFRQGTRGSWQEPITAVADELKQWAHI